MTTVSNIVVACPGVTSYGHGLTETFVHGWGCCDRFAALPDDERAKTGLRLPRTDFEPTSPRS